MKRFPIVAAIFYLLLPVWVGAEKISGMKTNLAGEHKYGLTCTNHHSFERAMDFPQGATTQQKIYLLKIVSNTWVGKYSYRSNPRGVMYILNGKHQEAIDLFAMIATNNPNNYLAPTLLALAYDESGDYASAIKWITIGLERKQEDPYDGTEWLYKVILEHRLLLEEKPDYLKTNRVIPLPEGLNVNSMINVGGYETSAAELAETITDQLSERIVIEGMGDSVIADLFYTLACLEAQTCVLEYAVRYLDLAEDAGFSDSELISEKRSEFKRIIKKAERNDAWARYVFLFGGFFILYVLMPTYKFLKSPFKREESM